MPRPTQRPPSSHPRRQRLQQQLAADLLQALQAVLEQLELAVDEREAHRHLGRQRAVPSGGAAVQCWRLRRDLRLCVPPQATSLYVPSRQGALRSAGKDQVFLERFAASEGSACLLQAYVADRGRGLGTRQGEMACEEECKCKLTWRPPFSSLPRLSAL